MKLLIFHDNKSSNFLIRIQPNYVLKIKSIEKEEEEISNFVFKNLKKKKKKT
jgi:hypothetical protein